MLSWAWLGVICAGAFFFVVLYWWSEGIYDHSDALFLFLVFGGLIFGMFAAQTLWQFLLAFIPLVGSGAFLFYSYKVGGMRSFYKQRCEEYMRAIQFDPRNLGAREALADALYGMDQLDRAIDEIQAAVDLGGSMQCRYKLGRWTKERHIRDTVNPVCRICETENSLGDRACKRCGADLPYDNAFTRWVMGGKTAKGRFFLIFLTGLAVVCISLLALPPVFAFIPMVLFGLIILGWWLAGSARA